MSAIQGYLLDRFGITLEPSLSTKEAGAGKHIVYASSLDSSGARNEETRGIIIGKMNGAFKPSSDFLQSFGWMCTRNIIFVGMEDARAFCSGKEIGAGSGWCSRGYVAISYNGVVLGCAFFDGEKALNMVPQHKKILQGGNEPL
jgi:NOL1/NOP2/fmu family ribosome biogenesis protein